MIALRRISYEGSAEVLRIARGGRIGAAPAEDYKRAMTESEILMGLR